MKLVSLRPRAPNAGRALVGSWRSPAFLAALAFLAFTSLVPILRTVSEAFIERDAAGGMRFTLSQAASMFSVTGPDPFVWLRALGNSVLVAGLAAALALLVGIPFAFLIARTDLPGRRIFESIYAAPLVLPPLLVAIAWALVFDPRREMSADISVVQWMIAIVRAAALFALCTFPLVVLFTTRALRSIPASVEESARLVAGPWTAVRRVTIPLCLPAALCGAAFVFLFALHDFSLVDYLNWVRPLAQQVNVYAFKSFGAWTRSESPGIATAAGLPIGIVGAVVLVAALRQVRKTAVATTGGDFRPPRSFALGAWRWPACAAAAGLLVVAVGMPVFVLVRKAGGLDAFRRAFRIIAGSESSSNELAWSLWLGIGAAVLALFPAFVLAHHAARRRTIWAAALAFLPLALPPIFLGIGALKLWSSPAFAISLPGGGERNVLTDVDGPRLGSMLLLAAKYLPFAIAALWAAFLAIDPKLEESAATAGVRPLDRALGITAPLAARSVALALALVLVFSLREIDTIVLLSSDTLMRRIYSMVHLDRDDQVAALSTILIALQAIPFALLAFLLPRSRAEDETTA